MKTRLWILAPAVLLVLAPAAWAHKPLLSVDEGEKPGTIYIEAGFSDGSSGAGHKITLKEEETGKVIKEYKVGPDGTLDNIPIPKVPYTVTFDAGPGHAVTKKGPAAQDDAEPSEPPKTPETTKPAGEKPTTPQPARVKPAESPSRPRPVVVAPGPGADTAFKMMITTQIVMASVLVLLFGAVLFFIGYSLGRNAAGRKRA